MSTFGEGGWYDVPDSDDQRYWDGEHWTESFRPRPVAPEFSPPAPTSGLAIASLVLGIASFFVSCLGIVTGIVGFFLGLSALRETQPQGPKRGRGLAIAGMICSAIAFAIMTTLTLLFVFLMRVTS
jgi:hypothetical protein